MVVCFVQKKKKGKGSKSDYAAPFPFTSSHNPATNGSSEQNLLGEAGFGCVYKGLLDGREVAVKQLKIGSGQGERDFRAEVETISRVHHRHLVSLVGYCISEHQRLLVYDFALVSDFGLAKLALDWPWNVRDDPL
ncbi:hypothetical protein RYX36_011217 [Vicia faba]